MSESGGWPSNGHFLQCLKWEHIFSTQDDPGYKPMSHHESMNGVFPLHFQTNPQSRREDLCSRGAVSSPYRAQVACCIRDSVSIDCWNVDIKQMWLKAADALRPIGDHNDFQPDNILRVFFISRLKLWSIEASAELLESWKCGAYLKIQGSCVSLAGKETHVRPNFNTAFEPILKQCWIQF